MDTSILSLQVEIVCLFEKVHYKLYSVSVHDVYRHCNTSTHSVRYSVGIWWFPEQAAPFYDVEPV